MIFQVAVMKMVYFSVFAFHVAQSASVSSLQPLVPVHVEGPTIAQCQGIMAGKNDAPRNYCYINGRDI